MRTTKVLPGSREFGGHRIATALLVACGALALQGCGDGAASTDSTAAAATTTSGTTGSSTTTGTTADTSTTATNQTIGGTIATDASSANTSSTGTSTSTSTTASTSAGTTSTAAAAPTTSNGTSTTAPTTTTTQIAAASSAMLTWSAPLENTDGSMLTNLAGYRIYFGQDPNNLKVVADMNWGGYNWFRFDGLPAGVWYFSIRSYSTLGVESELAPIVSKMVS